MITDLDEMERLAKAYGGEGNCMFERAAILALIAKLKQYHDYFDGRHSKLRRDDEDRLQFQIKCDEARHRHAMEICDELRALREQNEKMREALKPFAKSSKELDEEDENRWSVWEHPIAMTVTVGDFRAAGAALDTKEPGK